MIKKLQNDYTTPEQSKRLLELGLPAESANITITGHVYYEHSTHTNRPYWEYKMINFKGKPDMECYLPCWSVGRLIEIYRQFVFSVELLGTLILNDDIIEAIISSMETSVNKCGIDFSKLEE